MKTKTIKDITIKEEDSFTFEDGTTRTAYKAYYSDGTWMATFWNPAPAPTPGRPEPLWANLWEFEAWIAWARS